MQWGVARVETGSELKVSDSFLRSGFATCVPRVIITWPKSVVLFPGFVFVHFRFDDPYAWQEIRHTLRVIEILGGADPGPIYPSEIEYFLGVFGSSGVLFGGVAAPQSPSLGDNVTILSGIFGERRGQITWNSASRATVSIDGIDRPINLPMSLLKLETSDSFEVGREEYLRSRIMRRLRSKERPVERHDFKLGCTISELIIHISSQFHSGMTWHNWGTAWRLDHLRPQFLFDDDRHAVFHYTNLRPLIIDEFMVKEAADLALLRRITEFQGKLHKHA
jgi:transcription antitermination factor NusG